MGLASKFRSVPPAFLLGMLLSGANSACQTPDTSQLGAMPSTSSSFTCVIVDGRTDVPIANADVRWYELDFERPQEFDDLAWWDAFDEFTLEDYSDDDARAASSGHVATSDAQGRVSIEGSPVGTIVVARSGSLWGRMSRFMPDGAEQRLELFPDADVTIHVRDADGHSSPGVPVVIQYASGSDASFPIARMRVRSDEQGTARLAHAGFLIHSNLDDWSVRSSTNAAWSVAPDICATIRPELALDPLALPLDPLELRLPPLGEVELLVREPGGRPAALELPPALLLAANLPEDVRPGPTHGWSGGRGPRVRADVHGGRALFRHVGLGSNLAVKLQPNTASQTWVERFQGPTTPGERVSVTVTLTGGTPNFVGRLVDAAQRPLAKVRVATDLFSLPSPTRTQFANQWPDEAIHSGRGGLTTDADGRFWLAYGDDSADGGVPLLVLTVARNQPDSLAARVDLGPLWSAGVHELGEVVLTPTPIVAAGKVVDSDGRPIEGASLGISVFKGSAHVRATTDSNGDFALRSGEPHDELWFHAIAPGYQSAFVQALPGDLELQVVLSGAGSITGSILFPEGTRFGDFYFHIERNPQGRSSHGWWEHHPEEGDFRMRDLEPGTYSLYVRREMNGEKILAREGISVRPGETTRVDPIDLVELLEKR